jgi:dihydrofolate reductase
MRKLVVCVNVTLDGVMQAPGRADEDTRGDFTHGGWAAPYAAMTQAGHVFAATDALLLGRRTYLDFADVWPKRTNSPFTDWLTNVTKYVASTTLREPLPWANSVLLKGDVGEAVESVKRQPGRDILIMGSGILTQELMAARLIDEYVLLIHPLLLGCGRRLFAENGPFASLKLVASDVTDQGVFIGTYRPTA